MNFVNEKDVNSFYVHFLHSMLTQKTQQKHASKIFCNHKCKVRKYFPFALVNTKTNNITRILLKYCVFFHFFVVFFCFVVNRKLKKTQNTKTVHKKTYLYISKTLRTIVFEKMSFHI